MSLSNFLHQYALRAYSRQLANWTHLFKAYKNKEITISKENKGRLLVDRIVQEIMGQFGDGSQLSGRCRNFLEQLSQEYGQALELSNHRGEEIAFKILDEKSREMKYLSASENERLVFK